MTAKVSSFILLTVSWPELVCLWALVALVIGMAVMYLLYFTWTEEIDPGYTVGDAALAMTSPEQCNDADYRLNRKEIFLKVRRVLAYVSGVEPHEITPVHERLPTSPPSTLDPSAPACASGFRTIRLARIARSRMSGRKITAS